jgi:hypothetical protein
MSFTTRGTSSGLGALASAAVLLGACSGDPAAPAAPTLTTQQAAQVGTQVARDVGAALGALRLGGGNALALTAVAADRAAAADVAAPCPAPSNTADADRDGIPDDATITFALPQCRTIVNGDTTEVTGTVRLADPVFSPPPDVQAFGYQAWLRDVVVRHVAAVADSSYTETRNGAIALMANAQGLVQAHALDVVRVDRAGTVHATTRWQATFAPATGSAFVIGGALPAGRFSVEGVSGWEKGANAQQFAIATAVPLAYDPACAATQPNAFRSGEVRAVSAGAGGQAVVRIVFADCLAPTITLVARPAP